MAEEQKRFRDFDAFWAEQKREPLRARIMGEDVELPPALPALVVLELLELQAQGIDDVTEAKILGMSIDIFGRERVRAWANRGMDIEQLKDALNWAFGMYGAGLAGAEEDAPGNPDSRP